MGDDIGWFNISAYHQGIMASRTPNIDRLAAEGTRFTDYYAEASWYSRGARQLHHRTTADLDRSHATVGQAGAKIGMPDKAPTIATALRAQPGTPPGSSERITSATATSSCRRFTGLTNSGATSTISTRWRIRSTATTSQELRRTRSVRAISCTASHRTSTIRRKIRVGAGSGSRRSSTKDRCPRARRPASSTTWRRSTRSFSSARPISSRRRSPPRCRSSVSACTAHCSPSRICRRSTTRCARRRTAGVSTRPVSRNSTTSSAVSCRSSDDLGIADNTILHRHDRQWRRELHLARRRTDPVRRRQGSRARRRVPRAVHSALAATRASGQSRNGVNLGARLVSDAACRRRQLTITEDLLDGDHAGRSNLSRSPRRLQPTGFHLRARTSRSRTTRSSTSLESTVGAVRRQATYKYRFIDQPQGWLGGTVKPDWPILVNLRLDPFERTGLGGLTRVHRVVQVRVLALRAGARGDGAVRQVVRGLSAHAGGGDVQPPMP